MSEVVVVILTWKRLQNLKNTIRMLQQQTFKKFDVAISNGDLSKSDLVDRHAALGRRSGMRLEVSHDGNDLYSFRRFHVARRYAQMGYKRVVFLDDDIVFSKNYVRECIRQSEPMSYTSGYAWRFLNGGEDYYNLRTRVTDNNQRIHYCGAGVSVLDASIFLNDGLIDDAPETAYKIEDLWLSYYVDHVLGLPLRHMSLSGVRINGADDVALFREIQESAYNKAHFLRDLVHMGWDLTK